MARKRCPVGSIRSDNGKCVSKQEKGTMKILVTDDDHEYMEAVPYAHDVRGRRDVVVIYPWEGGPAVCSWHASPRAAELEARRRVRGFAHHNPGGYGYVWRYGRVWVD